MGMYFYLYIFQTHFTNWYVDMLNLSNVSTI